MGLSRKFVVGCGTALVGATLFTGCTSTASVDDPSKAAVHTASVKALDLDETLASQTVTLPNGTDKVTVGVVSLEVDGKLQILHLVLTPDFSSVAEGDELTLHQMLGEMYFNPTLIDTTNLKIYSVVDGYTTHEYDATTTNGEPLYVWAAFAAPEDDATSFDVRVADAWPAFTDVPVTK